MIDKKSLLPIPYATIKVLHKPQGVVASETGEFKLVLDPEDSVAISCVGYFSSILLARDMGSKITLAPKFKSLANATIQTYKTIETLLIGDKSTKYIESKYWGPGVNLKEEFAQKMELPDSAATYKIKKVFIPADKFKCYGPMLLHVYLPDTNSLYPGEEVFMKLLAPTFETVQYKKNKLVVDLEKENILISGVSTFFISLSWPEEAYWSKCITLVMIARNSNETTIKRHLNSNGYYWFSFGDATDINGNSYRATTAYSAVLDKLK